ncbi:hypothetical protein [Staphylococcus auricularis]|uniref:hypothetical protein n=1 Tax=Staphylococcus auricularis TaxID=29379 RepID=UPI0017848552|nr:hypothetical protein [Staphylococcus auricularis]
MMEDEEQLGGLEGKDDEEGVEGIDGKGEERNGEDEEKMFMEEYMKLVDERSRIDMVV